MFPFRQNNRQSSVPSGIFPEMSAPKSHVPSTRESAVGFGKSEPYSRPSSGGVKVMSSIAFSPRITAAASITASTMGLYPVQRQTLPCRVNHSLTSSRVGSGLLHQKPFGRHDEPRRTEAALHARIRHERPLQRMKPSAEPMPSMVLTFAYALTCFIFLTQERVTSPSSSSEQAPRARFRTRLSSR